MRNPLKRSMQLTQLYVCLVGLDRGRRVATKKGTMSQRETSGAEGFALCHYLAHPTSPTTLFGHLQTLGLPLDVQALINMFTVNTTTNQAMEGYQQSWHRRQTQTSRNYELVRFSLVCKNHQSVSLRLQLCFVRRRNVRYYVFQWSKFGHLSMASILRQTKFGPLLILQPPACLNDWPTAAPHVFMS